MLQLKHPKHSLGANLVLQHIEELEEEDRLNRENLEEKVRENPRLSVEKLDDMMNSKQKNNIYKV